MQDSNRDGALTPVDAATFAALAPVLDEYTRPEDNVRVKVVPHEVYVHQQKQIAQARKRRKLAEASRRKGRRK